MEPWILTYTGKKFYAGDPSPDSICIEDIAHALSLTCRYSGHCSKFYSVARHSIEVAQVLPDELKLKGLLHDASEAYLTDVPSPFKSLLHGYRDLETKVSDAIFKRFGLPTGIPEEIHQADHYILLCEAPRLGLTWASLEDGDPEWTLPESNPAADELAFLWWFRRYYGNV